jgi:predicted small secreted protein
MRIGTPLALLFLALALLLSACGDDEGDGGDVTDAERSAEKAAKSEQPSKTELTRFLMRTDEEPGFRPVGQPRTDTGVEAFVKGGGLTQADARRLRSEGFIAFTFQPIRGPRTAGVTNVALYETAEGAKHSMAHDLRPDVIRALGPVANLRYFTVPGIPGARGWTASKPHVGNLHWVQGRCFLVLGNQGPGPFAGPLSAGARAIYERTNGQCP